MAKQATDWADVAVGEIITVVSMGREPHAFPMVPVAELVEMTVTRMSYYQEHATAPKKPALEGNPTDNRYACFNACWREELGMWVSGAYDNEQVQNAMARLMA